MPRPKQNAKNDLFADGVIREREAEGRWEWRTTDARGRRVSLYAPSKEKLKVKVRKAIHDSGGRLNRRAPLTVKDFIETVWLSAVKDRRKAKTYIDYESVASGFIIPRLGRRRLDALTAEHIERWLEDLRADKCTADTVHRAYRRLVTALNVALRKGFIHDNPALRVDAPSVTRVRRGTYSTDEARRILTAAAGHPYEAFFILSIYAGLRASEILGLRWEDVDFDGRVIHLRQRVVEVKGGLDIDTPKTENSMHEVYLSEPEVLVLRARLAIAQGDAAKRAVWSCDRHTSYERAKRLAEGARPNARFDAESPWVFGQTVNGQPWRSSNFIRRVYDPVIVLSGVQRRPMAATRSTATTIMSEAGVPIEHIARRLGHADIRTTRKYYLGPSERADRRAADAQAQYIRGAPEETPKTD